jgi:2-methylcitrate dehydratase PrpD
MKDNTQYKAQVDYPKGSLENPMTDQEHENKFRMLAAHVLPIQKIDQVIQIVNKLEGVQDISQITRLLY